LLLFYSFPSFQLFPMFKAFHFFHFFPFVLFFSFFQLFSNIAGLSPMLFTFQLLRGGDPSDKLNAHSPTILFYYCFPFLKLFL
jgi:hypothetical protein